MCVIRIKPSLYWMKTVRHYTSFHVLDNRLYTTVAYDGDENKRDRQQPL